MRELRSQLKETLERNATTVDSFEMEEKNVFGSHDQAINLIHLMDIFSGQLTKI